MERQKTTKSVLIILICILLALLIFATAYVSARGYLYIRMDAKFTSAPIQVRFWDTAGEAYGEWENFPFPGGDDCQIGDASPKAQLRIRPGLEGVQLALETKNSIAGGKRIKAAVGEGIDTIVGTGQAEVGMIDAEAYSCDLVLTRK